MTETRTKTDTFITVIVCTHNPRADYLRRTIAGLRGQTMPLDHWELLLIDNASTEPVAATWDVSWHPQGRHIREAELGLTAARLRGIRNARGELLVFVDDDNVLAPDYLEVAARIRTSFPYLGVWGAGRIEPEFETEPPSEIVPRLSLLALRTVPAIRWSNNPNDDDCIPWGAGLCVTRSVADLYPKLVELLKATTVLGRKGQQLLAGEDNLFSWASARLGLGFGLFPELGITHLISSGRLTRHYFVRLIHGHAFSHGILNHLLRGSRPRPTRALIWVRLLLHGLKNGWFSAHCQRAEAKGRAEAVRFLAENQLASIEEGLKSPVANSPVTPSDLLGVGAADSGKVAQSQ